MEYTLNNIYFEAYQQLYNIINNYVVDVNNTRSALLGNGKQWIFPTTPEANDENYPRVALIAGEPRFESYGAGNYIEDVTNGETGNNREVLRTNYGKIAIMPFTIGIFTKKDQLHEVEYFDGSVHNIKNSKLSDHVGMQIAKILQIYRTKFIENGMDITVLSAGPSYDDNDFLWAKNIQIEIEIMDVWQRNYRPAELIKDITYNEIDIIEQ